MKKIFVSTFCRLSWLVNPLKKIPFLSSNAFDSFRDTSFEYEAHSKKAKKVKQRWASPSSISPGIASSLLESGMPHVRT